MSFLSRTINWVMMPFLRICVFDRHVLRVFLVPSLCISRLLYSPAFRNETLAFIMKSFL